MAICQYCNQEMMKADGCTMKTVQYPDGTEMPVDTYHFNEPNGRCHDCNAKHGEPHHPGCDVERCPKCGGQLISCGCLSEDDDEEE